MSNKEPIQTNSQLSELLLFQENFLALVHSQVYRCQPPVTDSVLKFQINFLSQISDQINSMITQLTDQLVNKKRHYELSLRDCFQKWLQTDYLCLLRINKFDVTKLSLFGFDIYVDPLEAVLQILNRLESAKKTIIDSPQTLQPVETAETALQKGWDTYILYANHWKLSFNIYILKEYLRVGAKSFLRKDRQILFTGITNFYSGLVPDLSAQNCTQLLIEMADLNNCLYYFHPSFNYFQFYSLLLPLHQNVEPIFACMREVAQKCLRTNILTPLLFGLLRHRQSFLRFIAEANSPFWLPYLNAIISGISINLKFRILQYQEILQIFQRATQKAGLIGELRTEEITGELQDGWRDAKQFFISAVKVGFNSGDVQTWKMIQFQNIGPRILNSITDGMLLNVEDNQEKLQLFIQKQDDRLQTELQLISSGKLNLNFIKSSLSELQSPISTQSQVYNLLRIVNLIHIGQHQNQYSLHFLMTCFIRIQYKMPTVLAKKVIEAAQKINEMLFGLKNINFAFIRDILLDFHSKFMPYCQIQNIVDLYYSSFEPKKCLSSLLHILCSQKDDARNKKIIISLIHRFMPHPNSNLTTIKTFEKCFSVRNELINVGYQTHSLISVFINEITKGSEIVTNLFFNIIKVCPWITFSLLNFPINQNGQLLSFASWLIDTPKCYWFLCSLLKQSKGAVQSQEGNDLILQLLYPNICDQIIKKINLTEQFDEVLTYSQLLMQIYLLYHETGNNCKDLLSVYLFLLSHATTYEQIQKVIFSISRIAELAFQNKAQAWIASLIKRKITGRSQGSADHHKKTLKNVKNSIYFMNELQNKIAQSNTEKPVYDSLQIIQQKLSVQQLNPQKQYSQQFIDNYRKMSQLNLEQIRSILKEQSIVMLEQLKQLCIPPIKQEHLKYIFTLIQSNEYKDIYNFTLDFLNLNADNYRQTIGYAISQKKVEYLSRNWFTGKLNSKFPQLLNLQQQSQTLFLKQMTKGLSTQQKQQISAQFFLQPSILELYIKHMEGLQFLTLYNNSNWRIVTDFFSRQLNNSKLPSTLLQYYQYVLITNQRNTEYEITSSKYLNIFSKFVTLFICKIQSIFAGSISKEQLSLKSTNELSSLNLIVSSFQLQQILAKTASLHKIMLQRSIEYETGWVDILWKLNDKINYYFDGNVIMPDFINGFCLTNDTVYNKHQTVIGVLLEQYYQTLDLQISIDKYFISKPQQQLTLKQIQCQQPIKQHCKIVFQQTDIAPLKQIYDNITTEMIKTGIFVNDNKKIGFNYQNNQLQHVDKRESCYLYIAGCLQACLPQQDRYELEPLILQVLGRRRLSWQLLKSIDSEQYHYVKTILVESQIAKKQLSFVYEGVPLIPNGEHLRVSDYNKETYCNMIALRAIGEKTILNISDFLGGYTCQTL